jgi:hypothetical protein
MVAAIEQAARAAEQRASFVADAKAAREEMLQTGTGFDADEVHEHLKAMITGKKTSQPKPRPWRD